MSRMGSRSTIVGVLMSPMNKRIKVMKPSGPFYLVETICAECRVKILRTPARAKRNCYCNGKCQMAYEYRVGIRDPHKITEGSHEFLRERTRMREETGNFTRQIGKRGYYVIITTKGRMYEHKYVWEKYHGKIPDGKVIHHRNGDRLDNRIENLELIKISAHHALHYKELIIGDDGRFMGK